MIKSNAFMIFSSCEIHNSASEINCRSFVNSSFSQRHHHDTIGIRRFHTPDSNNRNACGEDGADNRNEHIYCRRRFTSIYDFLLNFSANLLRRNVASRSICVVRVQWRASRLSCVRFAFETGNGVKH